MSGIHKRISKIIDDTKLTDRQKAGLNINENSNFVVTTYWWGRGKDNNNTARPCVSFYEEHIKKVITSCLNSLGKLPPDKTGKDYFQGLFDLKDIEFTKPFFSIINRMMNVYMNEICDYMKIGSKDFYNNKLSVLDRYKQLQRSHPEMLKNKDLKTILNKTINILKRGVVKNQQNLYKLLENSKKKENDKLEFDLLIAENRMQIKPEKAIINELETKLKIIKGDPVLFDCLKKEYGSDPVNYINNQINDVKKRIKTIKDRSLPYLEKAKYATQQKNEINKEIMEAFREKVAGKSLLDELIDVYRYLEPIKLEAMIDNWEEQCRKNGCNYLAIEYNEFSIDKATGYQMAINAKPKFIKKMLELCEGKNVVYIDGDMTIRQYPGLFDMTNIDFMARGWYIDPRSSYKLDESIMFDPYSFETSGGIMFFSTSAHAKKLLKLWIEVAEMSSNDGKADDRVLSLVFNTQCVLTWIKMIQLPVEYLWLTLDYDERMMDLVYDYNKNEMESSIMVDHPECLTSEDTATGAGAASDRQPKLSVFLEDLSPCDEVIHEHILFKDIPDFTNNKAQQQLIDYFNELERENPSTTKPQSALASEDIYNYFLEYVYPTEKHSTNTKYFPYFYWYFHFMGDVHYLNDGNQELIDIGYVIEDGEREDNVQPLSIVSYKERFGNNKHPAGDGLSVNELVDTNIKNALSINLDDLYESDNKMPYYLEEVEEEVKDDDMLFRKKIIINLKKGSFDSPINILESRELIKIILRLLLDNKCVIINPKQASNSFDQMLYNSFMSTIDEKYGEVDFVFCPIYKSWQFRRADFFKPKISFDQLIFIRPESRLIDFISMCSSLDYLSNLLVKGFYEFFSLTRVAFIHLPKTSRKIAGANVYNTELEVNSQKKLDKMIVDYNNSYMKSFVKKKQFKLKARKVKAKAKAKAKASKRVRLRIHSK